MRLTALMLVGPGESTRYLDRTLRVASGWASSILIVGDRCDHDTWDAAKIWATECRLVDCGAFHESRLRNISLEMCDAYLSAGDLVIVLDADEELRTLAGGDPCGVLNELAATPFDAWPVRFWHLWQPDGSQHRVDGYWQPSVGTRIYRHRPGLRLPDRKIGVPPVPAELSAPAEPRLAIAHWGYARPHDRLRKHAYYMRVDGGRYHLRSHLESIITEPVLEPVPCS